MERCWLWPLELTHRLASSLHFLAPPKRKQRKRQRRKVTVFPCLVSGPSFIHFFVLTSFASFFPASLPASSSFFSLFTLFYATGIGCLFPQLFNKTAVVCPQLHMFLCKHRRLGHDGFLYPERVLGMGVIARGIFQMQGSKGLELITSCYFVASAVIQTCVESSCLISECLKRNEKSVGM